MPIIICVAVCLAERERSVGECSRAVGISAANIAVWKNGRAKAVRFTTLDSICRVLGCQPGDILRWEPEESGEKPS